MKGRHPEGAAKRPSKDAAPKISGRRPWRLAELVIGPATSGRTHWLAPQGDGDRKSTRLNSSHLGISYAVCCLKKKKNRELPLAVAPRIELEHHLLHIVKLAEQAVDLLDRRPAPSGDPSFFFNDTATTEIYTLSHTTLFR